MDRGQILDPTKEYPATDFPNRHGTEITFYPDPLIFTGIPIEEYGFDFETLSSRLRNLAFLNPIEIELIDARLEVPFHEIYKYENGVSDFVNFLNKNKKTLHAPPIHFIKEKDGIVIELAFQYNESYNELIYRLCE